MGRHAQGAALRVRPLVVAVAVAVALTLAWPGNMLFEKTSLFSMAGSRTNCEKSSNSWCNFDLIRIRNIQTIEIALPAACKSQVCTIWQ
jgi:hypothetical protein